MNTLVIYDNDGKIFSEITGSYLVPHGGIQFLEIEVPNGKQINGVDTSVTPHQANLEDIPPTEVDKLKQQVTELQDALIEIADMVAGGAV